MKTLKTFVKSKLLGSAAALKRDEKGSFAVMSAVTMALLVGALAISIDISNGWFAKQRLQDTADAIALMAARGQIETQADLDAAAQAYFDVTYPGQSGARINLESITRTDDAVTVVATNNIDTFFTGVLGRSGLDVKVASTAQYSVRNIDIAMVLDTTFSMDGSRMASLKASANSLIDTFAEFDNENLRMSVVPFAQYVNVGLSRRNAAWLDVPADEVRTYMKRDVISQSNCRNVTRTGTNDGVPVTWTAQECDTVYSDPYPATWTATWQGCVGSRINPWHERIPYSGNKIPGLLNSDAKCGSEIAPLTNNLNAVKASISGLVARGETYMPAGLMWGMRALDNREPLTEASAPSPDTDKVMIVMTDGDNTKSKNNIKHNGGSRVNADDLTDRMCQTIKDENVRVFTIAYEVDDASTKNLLQGCASAAGDFFDASNAQQLNDAFQAIGASLNELRLTT